MKISLRRFFGNYLSKKAPSISLNSNSMELKNFLGKGRVFIGSSTEGKDIANKIITELKNKGLETLPWFDFFKNSRPPLQELEQISLHIDGAILIGTLDDQAIIREQKLIQMRDNVLYEYGLFSGIMGRSRCGLIVPDSDNFRIPSDFLGVSCYQTYSRENVDLIISNVVDALVTTISKPKTEETTKTRGLRLLQFISWIRNESLRLVQDWNNNSAKDLITKRVIAVSGFIQNDLVHFGLTAEYQKIEEIVAELINSFPKKIFNRNDNGLDDSLRMLLDGVRPNKKVLEGLFYYMSRGRSNYCRRECIFSEFWHQEQMRNRLPHDGFYNDFRSFRHFPERICNCEAWALGVAEAATCFERATSDNNPLSILEEWANKFLPKLNKAIIDFERRLHEELFGRL